MIIDGQRKKKEKSLTAEKYFLKKAESRKQKQKAERKEKKRKSKR